MAASSQQFCLRWNNHQSNIVSVFEQLLQSEAFVDVTLAVEGMSLKAHKVVLSACSPYFQAVLASHPDKHPIVILKDVRYGDMRDLLDFMYRGEVSVDQENLSGFLRVAESLRIKGLTEVNESKRLENSIASPYLLQQAVSGATPPGVVPQAPLTPLAGDPPPLKRPPLSPSAAFAAKRRRGRPPKISGEESEGEIGAAGNGSTGNLRGSCHPEPDEARTEAEIKVEVDEVVKEENSVEDHNDAENQPSDLSAGPSGEVHGKEESRLSKEDAERTRESPGTGSGITTHPAEWTPSDYDTEETLQTASSLVIHPSPLHSTPIGISSKIHPPSVTDIDKLYYTKNLLEAAMLKSPYEALKNDKNLHGSILLASLRAPLKFGLHGVYSERDLVERELADSSPLSPRTTSPQKPSQSSPTYHSSGTGSNSLTGPPSTNNSNNSASNNNNTKGVSVPIMSYCIQDNGFKCSKCFQTFTHPSNFHRHYITVHTDRRAHKCHVCGKEFKRKDNMMSHIRSVHRPGKEGHSIFREVSSVSPTLARDVSPLQEQLLQNIDKKFNVE